MIKLDVDEKSFDEHLLRNDLYVFMFEYGLIATLSVVLKAIKSYVKTRILISRTNRK